MDKLKYKQYNDSILDVNLNVYEKILKFKKDNDFAFDFVANVVNVLTDIDKDVIDTLPIKTLKKIYDKATDFGGVDGKIEVVSEWRNYKAIGEPEKYEDIDFNRLQFRFFETMKDETDIITIAMGVFVEDFDDLKDFEKKKDIFHERRKEFGSHMNLKTLLPYLMKYMEVTAEVVQDNLKELKPI